MTKEIKQKEAGNDKLDRIVELSLLFDFYGELLKDHKKRIFEDYVLNDLSLSEIAEEQGISRQGVYDLVKRCSKELIEYENNLHLVEKFQRTKSMVDRIKTISNEVLQNLLMSEEGSNTNSIQVYNVAEFMKMMKEIEQISENIIKDF